MLSKPLIASLIFLATSLPNAHAAPHAPAKPTAKSSTKPAIKAANKTPAKSAAKASRKSSPKTAKAADKRLAKSSATSAVQPSALAAMDTLPLSPTAQPSTPTGAVPSSTQAAVQHLAPEHIQPTVHASAQPSDALLVQPQPLVAPLPTTQPDALDKLVAQKSLVDRISDSLHHASDRTTQLVSHAMSLLGVPYRLGGTSVESGFDCSGFVRSVYQKTVGLMLPRTAAEQAASTRRIDKTDLSPGDLVFFNTMRRANSHVGIYVGDGKFIHAPRTGSTVRVESMNISYWQKRFNGARRVLTGDSAVTAPTAKANPSEENRTFLSMARLLDRESPAPRSVRLGGSYGKTAPAAAENMASPPPPASGDMSYGENI